jgi:OmpA-OmpF porin, OOP family
MKTPLITAITAAGLALAGAAEAQAIDPQWYVRADAGASFQGQVNGTPKAKADTGWTGDIAVGRQFNSNFRAEGQIVYSDSDRKSVDGKIKLLAGLANAYYDFDTGTKLRPFIGAGVGLGQVKLDGGSAIEDDDTGFAYQLQTGIAYPITDRIFAQVGYRYLGVADVKLGSGAQSFSGDYHDQAVTVGLTYKFGS